MSEPTGCCRAEVAGEPGAYCRNCDLLGGLDGFHVVDVDVSVGRLAVTVLTAPAPAGCPGCGVIAHSQGRRVHTLVDLPAFGRPVRLLWRKRTWTCAEHSCPAGTFTEQDERLARLRALLTQRACWWAVGQVRREHASVAGIARQLGTSWRTVWHSIEPLLEAMAADESRFGGVTTLGVDEHIWHHVDIAERGPHDEAWLAVLMELAQQRLNQDREELDLALETASRAGAEPLSPGVRVTGTRSQLLWDVLVEAYVRLGFDVVADEAFTSLVLAREQ